MTYDSDNDPVARKTAIFLDDLRDLVLTETTAQRQQIHTRWKQPLWGHPHESRTENH